MRSTELFAQPSCSRGVPRPRSVQYLMESLQQSSTALWMMFFLLETVKAAIQRRPYSAQQSQQPPSCLPLELRRLFLLAPISRDCFVLRILLGLTPRTCSRILHLTIEEAHQTLCAALEALPFLEAGNSRGTRSIPLGDRARLRLAARTVMKQGSNSKGT